MNKLSKIGILLTYTLSMIVPVMAYPATNWQVLDNNPDTVKIVAKPCYSDDKCDRSLYQLHNDGSIWKYNRESFGWDEIDRNPETIAIELDDTGQLYQLHNGSTIWKYTGEPYGWEELYTITESDQNQKTTQISASNNIYQLRSEGTIWKIMGNQLDLGWWQMLDNNQGITKIVATSGFLYKLQNDESIWKYTGEPCQFLVCSGWRNLISGGDIKSIYASGSRLYMLTKDGSIWRYYEGGCENCNYQGWKQLGNNSSTKDVVIAYNYLCCGEDYMYQLRTDGSIWKYSNNDWQQIENDYNATEIVSNEGLLGGGNLYELRNDGSILQYIT